MPLLAGVEEPPPAFWSWGRWLLLDAVSERWQENGNGFKIVPGKKGNVLLWMLHEKHVRGTWGWILVFLSQERPGGAPKHHHAPGKSG